MRVFEYSSTCLSRYYSSSVYYSRTCTVLFLHTTIELIWHYMHHHSCEQKKFKKALNLDQNKICGFKCGSTYRNTGSIINQMNIKDEKTPVKTNESASSAGTASTGCCDNNRAVRFSLLVLIIKIVTADLLTLLPSVVEEEGFCELEADRSTS